MNAPAQTYFIHPKYQAQRTATPTLPMDYRLDTEAKVNAAKIREEVLRRQLGLTAVR